MAEANEVLIDQPEARDSREPEKSQSFHPLLELTLTRVREFLREREAVFWVFVFPVLMTFALGIAFRNTAPDKTFVAIEGNANDAAVSQTVNVLSRSSDISATVLSPDEAAQALRSGKVALVLKPAVNAIEYRFDPTRPESHLYGNKDFGTQVDREFLDSMRPLSSLAPDLRLARDRVRPDV